MIRKLARKLNVLHILGGLSAGVHLTKDINKGDTYLLVLDSKNMQVTTRSYSSGELRQASEDYMNIEKDNLVKPEIQAVLVSVDSVQKLRSAYPNFYLDTRRFAGVVREFIGK